MTRRQTVLLAFFLSALAAARAGAIPCPGSGAKLEIIVNNPTTTTGQKVVLTGSVVDGQSTCVGQADSYATTVTLGSTGNNSFVIPIAGGLNTGLWAHHIAIGDQSQHQRTPVLYTTDPMKYAEVNWTYFPTVVQVNRAGDATGACSSSVCTFRQGLASANALIQGSGVNAVLLQLMVSPGNMTQTANLDIGVIGVSKPLMIDGTDPVGNPWLVGDAFAAAQGNQSPIARAIDLNNATKLRVQGNNVTIRGLAVLNTVASGSPSKTLIEAEARTNTRIEAVRLDGGATGTCGTCVDQDMNLLSVSGLGTEIVNVEARAAFSHGARVGSSGGPVTIRDSWFRNNYASGVKANGVVLTRNTIELTGRRLSDNTVVTSSGVGVRQTELSDITTNANLIRNQTSHGIDALLTSEGLSFNDDAVCGNGGLGILVTGQGAVGGATAGGTGLATAYNQSHGFEAAGTFATGAVQINNDSAFTANNTCGFEKSSGTTASATNNQWRGATTSCSQSTDRCSTTVTCDPIQDFTNVAIALDLSEPAYPMNAIVKGQTLRVQGAGFNAITGNPQTTDPGANCTLGSGDVSSANCCRKKDKANVCGSGSPPAPPSASGQCVALLDPSLQWRALEVTSVTPTTITTEVPAPSVLCIGDAAGYVQQLRVVKQGSSGPIAAERPYCRNS